MKKYLLFILCISFLKVQAQTISSTGSMSSPREAHELQTLNNGNLIVFGGDNGDFLNLIAYKTAEIYNASTGTWSATGSMAEFRQAHASAILPSQKIIAIGGADKDYNYSKTCEIYDAASGTWSNTGSMSIERLNHDAIVLNNGKVLVGGGASSLVCELYDETTGIWTTTGSFNLSHGQGLSFVKLSDGKILVTSGEGTGTGKGELYDPVTETWTLIAPAMTATRQYHHSILLNNGNVLISGGCCTGYNTAEIYNPVANTFTVTGPLQEGRSDCPTILLKNGNVLVYGIGDFFNPFNTKKIEVYSPSTNTWSSQTYTGVGVYGYTAKRLANGKILIAGGINTTGNGSSSTCILINDLTVTTSTVASENKLSMTVYPNPSNSFIHFKINDLSILPDDDLQLKLISMTGEVIFNKSITNFELAIDVNILPKSLYTYQILSDQKVLYTGKIIIE
jgi:hypothetical protein